MTPGLPTQKLFRTAIYTSAILIGALALAPHIGLFKFPSHSGFVIGITSVALLILLLWLINIFLLFITQRFPALKFHAFKRYLTSYFICFSCILLSKRFIDSFV